MTKATRHPAPALDAAGWQASIALGYRAAGGRTVLARREHSGPLRVQKALYPEGDAVCHTLLLHPPGGIAGGDHLRMDISAASGAHALITTPGAGKWYGSRSAAAGRDAGSTLALQVAADATIEWLPQESIVFDGALAHVASLVELETGARFIGMDLYCLGRTASGERFTRGALHLDTRITQAGRTLWLEQARIAGNSPLLHSQAGLAGAPVFGTLLCAGFDADDTLLADCRAAPCMSGDVGVTRLPALLVARYRGTCTQAARAWFMHIWSLVRPTMTGLAAQAPRIWAT
ncbi:MAG: urease accessory protein UreD [Methyloversatilis sp.]|jgi:urease accessory protein|nr:urease accessory protein UreD [Methyloversatilis sp.]MBP6193641.1 urease accessory protein UreD [Methyloversatilis sp.]MBP9118250.1 urease accessory protein UreD [Methyloversatilis sp.]